MPDKTLRCVDCGNEFSFSEKDQEFYSQRGFSRPKRCKDCRDKHRRERGGSRGFGGKITGQHNKKNGRNKIKELLNMGSNFIAKPQVVMVVLTFFLAFFAWQQNSTHRKQLRAYIVVDQPNLCTNLGDTTSYGKKLEMTFIVRNDGQTPAYDVRDSIFFEVRPRYLGPQIPDSTHPLANTAIYGTRIPVERSKKSSEVYTIDHKIGFATGPEERRLRIFFSGKISYNDIFGDDHWTKFCYEYIFDHSKFFSYGGCNEADRD